jgi:hypothetical protein
MLDFGATVGSYLGSDYNQARLKMDDIYTFEKKLSEVFNIAIKKKVHHVFMYKLATY